MIKSNIIYEIFQKYKWYALWMSLLFLVTISSIVIYFSVQPTHEEEIALYCVNDLKERLTDPDSLKIYNDILIVRKRGAGISYIFIDYGSKNSYGGYDRKKIVYDYRTYLGEYEDNTLESIQARIAFFSFELNVDGYYGEYISKDKILKKLK